MNRGFAPILGLIAMLVSGVIFVVAFKFWKAPKIAMAPSPSAEVLSAETKALPSPSPSPSSAVINNNVKVSNTSSTHIRTETNGNIHDVTVPSNGNYEYHDANTSIVVKNNSN